MDDAQRIFTLLVEVLSESEPGRLRSPLEVAEIYQTLLPYRQYRSRLGFDTNQDYEMALLRLLAGEGGFASVDPAEVQQALAEEARAINPNPGAFRDYAAARVFLNTEAVENAVTSTDAYAPPPAPAPSWEPAEVEVPPPSDDLTSAATLPFTPVDLEPNEDPPESRPPRPSVEGLTRFDPDQDQSSGAPTSCPSCTRLLPRRSELRFCPYCGMDVTTPSCRFCGTDLDPDWAFCIACGRQKSAEF